MLNIKFAVEEIKYDGTQLKAHWIYNKFDIAGNSIVSFIGPCHVVGQDLVDLADSKNNDFIYSPKMLHFILEIFNENLYQMVLIQRLFIFILKEELEEMAIPGRITRKGDDLYHIGIADVKRKLSVSIATKSMTSTLMHTGINIHTQGAPVPVAGLHELGIDPSVFAAKIMKRFDEELNNIEFAKCKVRGV